VLSAQSKSVAVIAAMPVELAPLIGKLKPQSGGRR
jgi:hypothetical protein